MPQSDIIDFAPGLRVAIRSGYQSWYGIFTNITKTTATVKLPDGSEKRFSRNSRFEIGSDLSRYTRPHLTTVANSMEKDREYREATEKARKEMKIG